MDLRRIKSRAEVLRIDFKVVASRIGMSEGNLHRCVRENKIQAGDLEKVAAILKVPVSYFFEEEVSNVSIQGNGNQVVGNGASGIINSAGGNVKVAHGNSIERPCQSAPSSVATDEINSLREEVKRLKDKKEELQDKLNKANDKIISLLERNA